MTPDNKPAGSSSAGQIDFACPEEDVVVVRIVGRGSFQNSAALRAIPRLAREARVNGPSQRRYIVDLKQCVTMDSTFFGVLASIGLAQKKAGMERMVLVNVNPHIAKIMETLGLTQFMLLRELTTGAAVEPLPSVSAEFKSVTVEELGKVERIVLMLEAHQQLIDAYDKNEGRFKNVMECLEASLEAEGGKKDNGGSAPAPTV